MAKQKTPLWAGGLMGGLASHLLSGDEGSDEYAKDVPAGAGSEMGSAVAADPTLRGKPAAPGLGSRMLQGLSRGQGIVPSMMPESMEGALPPGGALGGAAGIIGKQLRDAGIGGAGSTLQRLSRGQGLIPSLMPKSMKAAPTGAGATAGAAKPQAAPKPAPKPTPKQAPKGQKAQAGQITKAPTGGKTTSAAYRIGAAMAKKAQNPGGPLVIGENIPEHQPPGRAPGIYMGGQRVNMPAQKPGGGVRMAAGGGAGPVQLEYGTGIYQGGQEVESTQRAPGIYAGQNATPSQPTSAMMTPNPAPTPTSTAGPATSSPAQPAAAKPSPAVSTSPAAPGAQPRPRPSTMMGNMGVGLSARPKMSAYQIGKLVKTATVNKKAKQTFMKIARALAKQAGLAEFEIEGMEKQSIAFMAALPWIIAALGGGLATHQYGKSQGWWESPAMKAARDRIKAIQMAQAQGIDPARMGLISPKEKPEKSDQPYWGKWGGGWSNNEMPDMPKGYMDEEKRLQNLSKHLGLGLRHARAYSQLSRMPVY